MLQDLQLSCQMNVKRNNTKLAAAMEGLICLLFSNSLYLVRKLQLMVLCAADDEAGIQAANAELEKWGPKLRMASLRLARARRRASQPPVPVPTLTGQRSCPTQPTAFICVLGLLPAAGSEDSYTATRPQRSRSG